MKSVTPARRVVVITGASSGIGFATAARAARAGDHVVLAARGLLPGLEMAADACQALGAASVIVSACDVGDDDEVRALFERARTVHGQLDAVVHAAGVAAYGRMETVPRVVFDGVLRTNLTGSVNVARHALRMMRAQRRGTLVLVGSVVGHIAVPSMSPYVISKWGVRALARQLQVENRDVADLQVAYVAPGGVDTAIYRHAANYSGFMGAPPPPVRQADDVAKAILVLLEDPRPRTLPGLSSRLIRLGFTALPGVFDVLVGPLYKLLASDRSAPVRASAGNVLAACDARAAELDRDHRGTTGTVTRNALALARGAARKRSA